MVSGFFTKKIAQVQRVGDILEQRRLSLGIAMDRVSRETAVQGRYLRAIETGDDRALPADIYVRGFVRTYARYLRLDEEHMLERWDRERGIAKHMTESHVEDTVTPTLAKTFPDRRPLLPRIQVTPLMFRSMLVALVIVAGFLYITLAVSSLGKAPALHLNEPTSDRQVDDSSIVLVGETRPEAQLSINGQPVLVNGDGKFRETVQLQAGMNQIRIIAESKLGRKTEIVRNIQANLDPVAAKDEDAEDAPIVSKSTEEQEAPVDLTVKISSEATWVAVTIDGRDAFEGTLLPNSQKRFKGDKKIVLTTGKGDTTGITFNGEDLSSLGEGFVREVIFTPDLSIQDIYTTAVRE
jgi:cytoskeletal protein RodZ